MSFLQYNFLFVFFFLIFDTISTKDLFGGSCIKVIFRNCHNSENVKTDNQIRRYISIVEK